MAPEDPGQGENWWYLSIGQVISEKGAGWAERRRCTFCAVSATAKPPRASAPAEFEAVLRRAGAAVAARVGGPAAIIFGSAAAELAVCVRTVGLVDRSDLSTLALEAPPAQLSALMRRMAGATVAPGGLVAGGSALWCGET